MYPHILRINTCSNSLNNLEAALSRELCKRWRFTLENLTADTEMTDMIITFSNFEVRFRLYSSLNSNVLTSTSFRLIEEVVKRSPE